MVTMHPFGQAQNGGSSANSREIPVSVDHVCPEGNENQYVTFPSGWALGRNVNARRSKRIRKSPQRYNPGFGASIEWKNDTVASIVYMLQDRDLDSNVDTDEILSLLDKWDVEYCIDTPSTFHMREYYFSRIKAMILILQRIWRHYQAKIRKNNLRQWMMKSKVLWEGTHGRLF